MSFPTRNTNAYGYNALPQCPPRQSIQVPLPMSAMTNKVFLSHPQNGNNVPTAAAAAAAAAAPVAATDAEETSKTNLNVRRLAPSVDEDELFSVFSSFGTITSHLIMRNIRTGESLGTAFVRFARHEDAKAALSFFARWEEIVHALRHDGHAPASLVPYGNGPAPTPGRNLTEEDVLDVISFPDDPFLNAVCGTLRGNSLFRASNFLRVTLQWARKQHDDTPDPTLRRHIRKLFVRNVPCDLTEKDLIHYFGHFGAVESASVHRDTAAAAATLVAIAIRRRKMQELAALTGDADLSVGLSGHEDDTAMEKDGKDETEAAANHASNTERRIAFVIFAEDGAAERAATAVHNTKPFPSCYNIPLMVKLAEDNSAEKKREERMLKSKNHDRAGAKARPNRQRRDHKQQAQQQQQQLSDARSGSRVSSPLATPRAISLATAAERFAERFGFSPASAHSPSQRVGSHLGHHVQGGAVLGASVSPCPYDDADIPSSESAFLSNDNSHPNSLIRRQTSMMMYSTKSVSPQEMSHTSTQGQTTAVLFAADESLRGCSVLSHELHASLLPAPSHMVAVPVSNASSPSRTPNAPSHMLSPISVHVTTGVVRNGSGRSSGQCALDLTPAAMVTPTGGHEGRSAVSGMSGQSHSSRLSNSSAYRGQPLVMNHTQAMQPPAVSRPSAPGRRYRHNPYSFVEARQYQ